MVFIYMNKLRIYYTIRYIANYFICYTTLLHLSNLQPYNFFFFKHIYLLKAIYVYMHATIYIFFTWN